MNERRLADLSEADALDSGPEPRIGARHIDDVEAEPRALSGSIVQALPVVAHEIETDRVPVRLTGHAPFELTLELNSRLAQLQNHLVEFRHHRGLVCRRVPRDRGVHRIEWLDGHGVLLFHEPHQALRGLTNLLYTPLRGRTVPRMDLDRMVEPRSLVRGVARQRKSAIGQLADHGLRARCSRVAGDCF